MNAVLVVLSVTLFGAVASAHVYEDGEINCIGANDEGRMYWDPTDSTKYWVCPPGEDYGKKLSCPAGAVFHAEEQRCIPTGAPIVCTKATASDRMYRDLDDATQYWTCDKGVNYATKHKCPNEHAFMEDDQQCVPWSQWKWTPPKTN